MVQYLERLILDNWKNWVGNKRPEFFDFLKINAGQAVRNKKVGFFIFKIKKPIFFVKTVRESKHNEIIKKSFEKSKSIYRYLNDGSVPKPFYFGNYQKIYFYIETALYGKQFHSCKTKKDLEEFLNWFFDFQRLMVKKGNGGSIKLTEYIDNLVIKFCDLYEIEKELKELTKNIISKKDIDNLQIPLIPQHGDLTPDNVLSDKGKIRVIDWDNFGKINLPLFDLLVFLQRWSNIRDISFLDKHSKLIEGYLEKFGIDKRCLKSLVFSYYLLDFIRKKEELTDYDKKYLKSRLKEIKKKKFKL